MEYPENNHSTISPSSVEISNASGLINQTDSSLKLTNASIDWLIKTWYPTLEDKDTEELLYECAHYMSGCEHFSYEDRKRFVFICHIELGVADIVRTVRLAKKIMRDPSNEEDLRLFTAHNGGCLPEKIKEKIQLEHDRIVQDYLEIKKPQLEAGIYHPARKEVIFWADKFEGFTRRKREKIIRECCELRVGDPGEIAIAMHVLRLNCDSATFNSHNIYSIISNVSDVLFVSKCEQIDAVLSRFEEEEIQKGIDQIIDFRKIIRVLVGIIGIVFIIIGLFLLVDQLIDLIQSNGVKIYVVIIILICCFPLIIFFFKRTKELLSHLIEFIKK